MTIETGPPDDSYDDNVEFLIDSLPEYMENDTTSGNWKLFSPIGNQFDALETDLQSSSGAISVQEAETIEQLERHGKLVDVSHNQGETIEHYRARIFAQYQLNTSEGTIGDILNSVSNILFVNPDRITYVELSASAVAQIKMPKSAVDNLILQPSEIADILNQLTAAGHELKATVKGTFAYVTPQTYTNTTDWTEYEGYDGLDTNSDPKNNGGTYAGIVN